MAMVWVVDDEESIRVLLTKLLEGLGHRVKSFADAQEALDSYRPGAAEVIISDVRMPNIDGIAFTHAILDRDPEASIIILTGYPSVNTAVEAMQVGAVDFLSKPCNVGELRVRVDRALDIRAWQVRLRKNRLLTLSLILSLPLWIILGVILVSFLH
jgi:DNA-binding NtrC family response regulator